MDAIGGASKHADKKCHFCGKLGHLVKDCFKKKREAGNQGKKNQGGAKPKKKIKCFNCSREGHIAKECRSKKKDRVRKVDEDSDEDLDEDDIDGMVNKIEDDIPHFYRPAAYGKGRRGQQ